MKQIKGKPRSGQDIKRLYIIQLLTIKHNYPWQASERLEVSGMSYKVEVICNELNSAPLPQIHAHPEPENVTYLEMGSFQMSLVELKPYWIKWALNS